MSLFEAFLGTSQKSRLSFCDLVGISNKASFVPFLQLQMSFQLYLAPSLSQFAETSYGVVALQETFPMNINLCSIWTIFKCNIRKFQSFVRAYIFVLLEKSHQNLSREILYHFNRFPQLLESESLIKTFEIFLQAIFRKPFLDNVLRHLPSSVSIRQFVHYAQIINSGGGTLALYLQSK